MDKFKIFVIMPFEDQFFEVYEMLKTRFNDKFEFNHAGDLDNQQNILKDIVQGIFDADIVIADLTNNNANVFYELGIAHSLNKKTIIITQELSKLPFDIKSYRANEYSTHFVKFDNLINSLEKYTNGAISGEISYSNPVSDFLIQKDENTYNALFKKENSDIINQEDKGFLDFIADIEENTICLTKNIADLCDGLNIMNSGVTKSTSEIERVQKTGGTSAAFMRKEAKKVAIFLDEFDLKVKEYNTSHRYLWDQIEKDLLALLESKFSQTNENKDELVKSLKALKILQNSAIQSNEQTKGMVESYVKLKGFERSLNQKIKILENDMNDYLQIIEQMIFSIDRVIDKSKFVVGNIDFDELHEKVENE